MFVRKPVICETDEFAQSIYNSIININSDFESGKSSRTFIDNRFNDSGSYMTTDKEQEFPIQKDTPFFMMCKKTEGESEKIIIDKTFAFC
ncbi:TPA: hypothetical protein ENX78_10755 [Candidatus Poribacteria bacterium]|nr:hypothetical protein [Candidatus Poribacteria bacterium]